VTEQDQIYEINTHLLYELRWMIHAANAFQHRTSTDPYVALLDSATVHGRNLFEFAGTPKTQFFTLASLGGTPKKSAEWDRWANNRVTHMTWREHDRAPWPDGLDNTRDDRFIVVADAVLKRLEEGGTVNHVRRNRDCIRHDDQRCSCVLETPEREATPRHGQAVRRQSGHSTLLTTTRRPASYEARR
jgi:hypothetical protein